MTPRRSFLKAGDTPITCVGYGPPEAAVLFVNLHENESTSVQAAQRVADTCPARLFRFDAGGQRRITFRLGNDEYSFDPNRIFSATGVAATLAKPVDAPASLRDRQLTRMRHFVTASRQLASTGAEVPEQVEAAVAAFATELTLLWEIDSAAAVLALHNTGDDYSVLAYTDGGADAASAADVHIEPEQHRHDFFFVSQRRIFEGLVARGFSVILQAPNIVDDGSLSVYCAERDIPYVNVEARYGQIELQSEMLQQVYPLLRSGNG